MKAPNSGAPSVEAIERRTEVDRSADDPMEPAITSRRRGCVYRRLSEPERRGTFAMSMYELRALVRAQRAPLIAFGISFALGVAAVLTVWPKTV